MYFVHRVILERFFDRDLWFCLRKAREPDKVSFLEIILCLSCADGRGEAGLKQTQDAILFCLQGTLDVVGGWSPWRWLDNLGRSITMSGSSTHGSKVCPRSHQLFPFQVHKQSRSTTATGVVFFLREIFAIEVCVKNESGASIVSRTHQTLFLWLQLYSCHGK